MCTFTGSIIVPFYSRLRCSQMQFHRFRHLFFICEVFLSRGLYITVLSMATTYLASEIVLFILMFKLVNRQRAASWKHREHGSIQVSMFYPGLCSGRRLNEESYGPGWLRSLPTKRSRQFRAAPDGSEICRFGLDYALPPSLMPHGVTAGKSPP